MNKKVMADYKQYLNNGGTLSLAKWLGTVMYSYHENGICRDEYYMTEGKIHTEWHFDGEEITWKNHRTGSTGKTTEKARIDMWKSKKRRELLEPKKDETNISFWLYSASQTYPIDYLTVIQNEEGNFDIMYISHNNSFCIQDNIADERMKDVIIRCCDKYNIGYKI